MADNFLDLELTGKVILDERSIDELKKSVREDAICDLKTNGCYLDEVVKYLEDCSLAGYLGIISTTATTMLEKIKEEDLVFSSDVKLRRKLEMIKNILDL